jgi:hypothetical protein
MVRATLRNVAFSVSLLAVSVLAADPHPQVTNPVIDLSKRCSAIRKRLLAITPPGTGAPQVAAFVAREMRAHGETREWVIADMTKIRNGAALIPRPNCETPGWHDVHVGVKKIEATFEAPSLSFVLVIPVSTKNVAQVRYAFNGDNRLLDIGVDRFTSGLP